MSLYEIDETDRYLIPADWSSGSAERHIPTALASDRRLAALDRRSVIGVVVEFELSRGDDLGGSTTNRDYRSVPPTGAALAEPSPVGRAVPDSPNYISRYTVYIRHPGLH